MKKDLDELSVDITKVLQSSDLKDLSVDVAEMTLDSITENALLR